MSDPIAWLADRLWGPAQEQPTPADPYDDPQTWPRASDPHPEES